MMESYIISQQISKRYDIFVIYMGGATLVEKVKNT